MKKKKLVLVMFLSLLISFFIFSTNNVFAERTIIIEKARSKGTINEGFTQYDYVEEKHESTGLFGWGSGKSTLKCYGQRDLACIFSHMPESLIVSDNELGTEELRDYAENQIANGNFNGTFSDQKVTPHGTFSRTVNWSGTASVECNIDINIITLTPGP
jgi:hypothetical protein